IALNAVQDVPLGTTDATGKVITSTSLWQHAEPNGAAAIIHDGTTFLTAWAESEFLLLTPGVQRRGRIFVNRGSSVNSPVPVVQEDQAADLAPFGNVVLARAPGGGRSVTLGWTRKTQQLGKSRFYFRRLRLPNDASSRVAWLDAPTVVLDTERI